MRQAFVVVEPPSTPRMYSRPARTGPVFSSKYCDLGQGAVQVIEPVEADLVAAQELFAAREGRARFAREYRGAVGLEVGGFLRNHEIDLRRGSP